MKKSRYTDNQMITILKQNESSISVADRCREHNMSQASFYQWRSQVWMWQYNNERPHTAIGGIPPRIMLKAA